MQFILSSWVTHNFQDLLQNINAGSAGINENHRRRQLDKFEGFRFLFEKVPQLSTSPHRRMPAHYEAKKLVHFEKSFKNIFIKKMRAYTEPFTSSLSSEI